MTRGPAMAGPRMIEVGCTVPARCLRQRPGYLGGNWELGAGGARLAVGAVAV